MDEAAATGRSSRRRKTPPRGDDGVDNAVQIVFDSPSPSSSKPSGRLKRDRKPSSSRDTLTPEPLAEELPKKTRARRSPSKGSAPTSRPKDSSSSQIIQDDQADSSSKPSSSQKPLAQDDDDDVDEGSAAPSRPRSEDADLGTDTNPNRSKRKAGAADLLESDVQEPPETIHPRGLANELFNDDEEVDVATTLSKDVNSGGDDDSNAVDVALSSRKRRRAGSDDSQVDSHPSSASFTTAFEANPTRQNAADAASLQLRIRQLEMQLAEAKTKVEQSAGLVSVQHNIFQDLHGQCICHICLEPSFRPCVLAPCGHVFCIHCLRSWFTKPLASEAPAPENWSQTEIERYNRSRTLKRKKICPSCRTELACPPVEVFLVRDMLEKVDEGLKLSKEADVDSQMAESSTAMLGQDDKARLKGEDLPKGAKLWEDIFDQDGPRRIIFDEMDGVPRCGSCGSEIFDGACSNPSCAIEYDSNSEYEDLRRRGWDDMDDFDSDHESEIDDDGMGGPRRPRRNDALAERLADFEARHGRSEGIHRGNRLDLPDDSTGINYLDSSDHEHMMRDDTETVRPRQHPSLRRHRRQDEGDEIDEEDDDDEEMDDFIVRDDFEDEEGDDIDRPRYFDDSASEGEGSEEEEDDFLPGPRRGGLRGSAIEISDDDDDGEEEEEEGEGRDEERDSSVEYRGRRGGSSGRFRIVHHDDDEDDDDERDSDDDSEQDEEEEDDDDDGERDTYFGSSTDSSARRRRARIIDDEDEEDDEVDEDDGF